MCELKKPCVALLVCVIALAGVSGKTSWGDDEGTHANISDTDADSPDDAGDGFVRFAIDHQLDTNHYWLTQTQPEEAATAEPPATTSRSAAVAARRRRSTYRLPSMFGDFYGGSSLQANIQLPSLRLDQLLVDNVGGVNFFVTNANGGNGADQNPAVPIQVRQNDPAGMVVTTSNGPAVPNGSSIAYPISDPGAPPAPGPGTFAYNGGTAFYTGAGSPGPVGDGENWGIQFSHQFTPDPILVNLPSGGGAVRRVKIAENNSPIPRDRFIFNYNYFNNVIGGIGDVNRYAVGTERTFQNGSSSIEVLFPMASTLDVDQIAGGMRSTDTEFGDLTLILKTLLWEQDDFLMAAGLGLTVPTGDDARVFTTTGQQIIDLQHDSTHLLPYIAMLRTYDCGFYWQSFIQLDIDINGNPLSADMNGQALRPAGVLQDQTLMFVDFGAGYWLHSPGEGNLAVAATAEIHWAGTLQDADVVNADGLNITSAVNRYDVVNLTLGASFLVNDCVTVRPAMVIPLSDDQFDYEAMLQMNFWR